MSLSRPPATTTARDGGTATAAAAKVHPGQYSKIDGRRVCARCVSAESSRRRELQRLAEHNALYYPPFTPRRSHRLHPRRFPADCSRPGAWLRRLGRADRWLCGRQPEYLVNDTPCCKAHLRQQVGAELARRDDAGLTPAVLVTYADPSRRPRGVRPKGPSDPVQRSPRFHDADQERGAATTGVRRGRHRRDQRKRPRQPRCRRRRWPGVCRVLPAASTRTAVQRRAKTCAGECFELHRRRRRAATTGRAKSVSARVATKPKRTTPVPEAASNGARALTGAAEANDAHPPEVSNGIGNFTPDRLGPLYHALMQAGARLVRVPRSHSPRRRTSSPEPRTEPTHDRRQHSRPGNP